MLTASWQQPLLPELLTGRASNHNCLVMELMSYGQTPAQLDATFAALADPTRRAILARLIDGEASVTELARPSP